jgi:hypothetical protein
VVKAQAHITALFRVDVRGNSSVLPLNLNTVVSHETPIQDIKKKYEQKPVKLQNDKYDDRVSPTYIDLTTSCFVDVNPLDTLLLFYDVF